MKELHINKHHSKNKVKKTQNVIICHKVKGVHR